MKEISYNKSKPRIEYVDAHPRIAGENEIIEYLTPDEIIAKYGDLLSDTQKSFLTDGNEK